MTQTSQLATCVSEVWPHQVRLIPDPSATACVPFARTSSTLSAHTVRLACLSAAQQLELSQRWAASTFSRRSMVGPSRVLKLPQSLQSSRDAVAHEASRSRSPLRGPAERTRRLGSPLKGQEVAGESHSRPRKRLMHHTLWLCVSLISMSSR
jgi:hypothetical protein